MKIGEDDPTRSDLAVTLEAIANGDRRLLATAITAIQDDTDFGRGLSAQLNRATRPRRVVGITGPAGAGKSTLIGALIQAMRGDGLRVASVMIDPSSPVTGGAVLGDRFRLPRSQVRADTFVRSLAHRGTHGGVAPHMAEIISLFGVASFDLLIIETVGSGQSETAITDHADLTIYVEPPGLGDGIQTMKAGIAEVADVLVVSKCELPGATQLAARWRSQVRRDAQVGRRRVMAVSADTGKGMKDLVLAVAEARTTPRPSTVEMNGGLQ